MPDIQICGARDFSVYDSMSDEDLEKLLRDDFSKPKGEEFDTDTLLYITEVLAKRKNDKHNEKSPAKAWESFKQNYYTENDDFCISESVPISSKRSGRHWRRGLIATAAVLVLVIGASVTAKAFKVDLWGTIARWTKETFYFSSQDQSAISDPPKYNSLQEALEQHHVSLALAPTWFPEGYEEVDIKIDQTSHQTLFIAQYKNQDKSILVQIIHRLDDAPLQYEQSGSSAEIYRSNGIDYYIFSNYDQLHAAWINENYECAISGPLSVSEIKSMIDSIGKG